MAGVNAPRRAKDWRMRDEMPPLTLDRAWSFWKSFGVWSLELELELFTANK